jgi:hypothetical protein
MIFRHLAILNVASDTKEPIVSLQYLKAVKNAGEWAQTRRDERFLSLLDNNLGVACYADAALYGVGVEHRQCSTPTPYKQMVIIHGFFMGSVGPLCFCLSTKTVGQYRQILRHICCKIRQICHNRWSPQQVVCDFEMSLLTAVESELIGTRVLKCWFNSTQ